MPQVDRAALSSEDEVMEMAGKQGDCSVCLFHCSVRLLPSSCLNWAQRPAALARRLTQDASFQPAAGSAAL